MTVTLSDLSLNRILHFNPQDPSANSTLRGSAETLSVEPRLIVPEPVFNILAGDLDDLAASSGLGTPWASCNR